MSAVSGALGANAQKGAAREAASATRDAAQMQVEASDRQYQQTRQDYEPYRNLGQVGLDQLLGKGGPGIKGISDAESMETPGTFADAMSGLGSYEQMMQGRGFDDTMQGYDPATAVERERKMGLQGLGNRMASRGIRGMNASRQLSDFNDQKNADLSNRQLAFNQQRYAARQGEGSNLYSNARNEATQRYQGAANDWQLKKANMQDRYNNLLKLVDVGRGATGNVSSAGESNVGRAVGAIGQMGQANANNAMAQGQAAGQMFQGLGRANTQIAGSLMNRNWGGGQQANAGSWNGSGYSGDSMSFAGNTAGSGMVDNYGDAYGG